MISGRVREKVLDSFERHQWGRGKDYRSQFADWARELGPQGVRAVARDPMLRRELLGRMERLRIPEHRKWLDRLVEIGNRPGLEPTSTQRSLAQVGQEVRGLTPVQGIQDRVREKEEGRKKETDVNRALNARLPSWLGVQELRVRQMNALRKRKQMEKWSGAQFWPGYKVPIDYRMRGKQLRDLPLWYLERLYTNQSLFRGLPVGVKRALEEIMRGKEVRRLRAEASEDRDARAGGYEVVEGVDRDFKRRAPYSDYAVSDSLPPAERFEKTAQGTVVPVYEIGTNQNFRGSRRPADLEYSPDQVEERQLGEFRRLQRAAMWGWSTVTGKPLEKIPGHMRPKVREAWELYRQATIEDEQMDVLRQRKANPKEAARGQPARDQADLADEEMQYDLRRFGMGGGSMSRKDRAYDHLGRLERTKTLDELQGWEDDFDSSYPRWRQTMPGLVTQYLGRLNALRAVGK